MDRACTTDMASEEALGRQGVPGEAERNAAGISTREACQGSKLWPAQE